jgi:hypothetical protein
LESQGFIDTNSTLKELLGGKLQEDVVKVCEIVSGKFDCE